MPGVLALDFGIPAQVFAEDPHYDLVVCAETVSPVSSSGFRITAPAGLDALDSADTVIVPGCEYRDKKVIGSRSDHRGMKAVREVSSGVAECAEVGFLHWCCEPAIKLTWVFRGTTECCSRCGGKHVQQSL